MPGARERRLTAAVTAVRDRVLALLARPGHTAEENLAAALAFARAAQRQLDIKMHKKIIVCEYCGRILIDPELAGVKVETEEKPKRRRTTRRKKTEEE